MRIVPTSWITSPPVVMPPAAIDFAPSVSSKLVNVYRICADCLSSCSLHAKWKRRAGIPHSSTTLGSISQYDFTFGIISPRPVQLTLTP